MRPSLAGISSNRDFDARFYTRLRSTVQAAQEGVTCVSLGGTASLLPETDIVLLCDGSVAGEPVGACPWHRVVQVAGNLMTEVAELSPPRYRVTEFPSPEQLVAIWERIGLTGWHLAYGD